MSHITTYTRKHIDPSRPDIDKIDIIDIAHALSLTCRGNGHVSHFFSVAEHCIYCAKEAKARNYSPIVVLACLLHDASEAYMSDVPRPFKKELQSYIEKETKLIQLIYHKFIGRNLTVEEARQVKEIDDDLLAYDLYYLLDEPVQLPHVHITYTNKVRMFEEIEQEYLTLFNKYSHNVLI